MLCVTSIVMYATLNCPFCIASRMLFNLFDVAAQEILIDQQPEKRAEMLKRAKGHHTVPQIFINGNHIGGFEDLLNYVKQNGKLQAANPETGIC